MFRIIPRELFLGPIPQTAPEETDIGSSLRPGVGEMVTIPAGEFIMGSEKPGAPQQRTVDLPSFQIDKYEATVNQYRVFAEETGHPEPSGAFSDEAADYPVTNVTWEDAQVYCEWAGKRLPTEAEWEKAARGTEGFVYPWGNDWNSEFANTRKSGIGELKPVGSFPEGASPYGVHDMAGNVWEWVEDWATSEQEAKVIRGGFWDAINRWAQTFSRNGVLPSYTKDNLGFRCAR